MWTSDYHSKQKLERFFEGYTINFGWYGYCFSISYPYFQNQGNFISKLPFVYVYIWLKEVEV